MTTERFLEDLADEIGGSVQADRVRFSLRGFAGSVEFISEDRLLVVVEAVPCHRLLLTPESDVTQELHRLGIPHETEIGVPDVDERYVIKNAPQEKARTILGPEFLEALRELEPFDELEMGTRNYRLLKTRGQDYDTAHAAADLDQLVRVAELTQVC